MADKRANFSVSFPESTFDLLEKLTEWERIKNPKYQIDRSSVLCAAFMEYLQKWAVENLPECQMPLLLKSIQRNLNGGQGTEN